MVSNSSAPQPTGTTPAGIPVYTFGGMEFVRVPAGKFLMGATGENKLAGYDERPQFEADVPFDYWIGRFPVTKEQYEKVIPPDAAGQVPGGSAKKASPYPITYISWKETLTFCRWLTDSVSGELPRGHVLRLPTEVEWEKAARGTDGREWPWGNDFDVKKCNAEKGSKGQVMPIGAFSPQGDSPYGCVDMAGNVWEWCHTLHKSYPYNANDGREDETDPGYRVLRGGSFYYERGIVRCASRYYHGPDQPVFNVIGFRVVVAPPIPVIIKR